MANKRKKGTKKVIAVSFLLQRALVYWIKSILQGARPDHDGANTDWSSNPNNSIGEPLI